MTRSGIIGFVKAPEPGPRIVNSAGEPIPDSIVQLTDSSSRVRRNIAHSQELAKQGFSRYTSFGVHPS